MKLTWGRGIALLGVAVVLGGCRHGGDGDVAQVRLINAVPDPDNLSVSVDNHSVWKRSPYGNNTGYQKVRPGTYKVQVTAGDSSASKAIAFEKNQAYTVLTLNAPHTPLLSFRVFPDAPKAAVPEGQVRLYFIDAANAPGVSRLDLLLDRIVAFPGVVYGHRSEGLLVESGDYDVRINAPDSLSTLAGPVTLHLEAGRSYTLVAMGSRATGLTLESYPDGG